jgi:8-oxo-dGTP pyrophosphatase MutT (NUDIX family)
MKDFFAVFVLVPVAGGYAMTTRDDGKTGLPGGKVDKGENPRDAVIREANEEGWAVSGVSDAPVYCAMVDGKPVAWFLATQAAPLEDYKEKSRGIRPIVGTRKQVISSGFGNEGLEFLI